MMSGRHLAAAAFERARVQNAGSNRWRHLIPGYGISVWRQNVALVESTIGDLSRQYISEQIGRIRTSALVMDGLYGNDSGHGHDSNKGNGHHGKAHP